MPAGHSIFNLGLVHSCPSFGLKVLHQGCELDRFLIEFKRHLQVRVQRFLFFEFKFEFGKNDRVQVHSPVQNIL